MTGKPTEKKELPFSVTAQTALLLGRESISSPVVAVLELVKNAYDADAESVTVRFRRASSPEGTIEIVDDGDGMTWHDIETKWMVIGTRHKQQEPVSPRGRVRVGEKGIGRFALDRLASQVIVETTPKATESETSEPTYRLTIDWNKFENTDKSLHDIQHPIEILERQGRQGTRLLLSNLRDRWKRRDYERLYRDLAVLVPPFGPIATGFSIRFDCDEAEDTSGRIHSPMAKAALFKMRARLDEESQIRIIIITRDDSPDGRFRIFRRYRRAWHELFDLSEDQLGEPHCGSLEFEFYFYLRGGDKAVQGVDVTLGRLRDFLDIYGGVRIYRDGFRVKPYGDPGGAGDWLGLSARRVQHPGGVASEFDKWVVGENQVATSVFISRAKNPDLVDQTNREGLFDNQAFRDMRSFVLKCIEVFETDRQRYEKSKPRDEEPSVKDRMQEAKREVVASVESLQKPLDLLPDESSKLSLAQALSEFRKAQVDRLDILEDVYEAERQETISKQQLMQNLATIGIATSSMGHEIVGTSRKIMRAVERLGERLNNLMLLADDTVKQYMDQLHRYGRILYSVSYFALGHVDRDKRRWQKVNVDSVIQDLHEEALREMCATNEAQIDLTLGGVGVPDIYAFPYEVESIVINFVTNSIAAFRRGRIPIADRRIEIETRYDESVRQISIIARDSGPGIPEGDEERIFEVYSTKVDDEGKPIGTGLGLAIVKDIADSHNGSIKVKRHGDILPGAEFIVALPVPRRRGRRNEREDGE